MKNTLGDAGILDSFLADEKFLEIIKKFPGILKILTFYENSKN